MNYLHHACFLKIVPKSTFKSALVKYYFTFFSFLFISICGFSQEVDEKEQVEKLEKIKAVVINAQDASVLESVHIIILLVKFKALFSSCY